MQAAGRANRPDDLVRVVIRAGDLLAQACKPKAASMKPKLLIAAMLAGLTALSAACTLSPDQPPDQPGQPGGATHTADLQARQAWLTACKDDDGWDTPAPPFRIHGNSWHVGTCGITTVLVTGPQGHILIDSGTQVGARVVAANIAALGFRLQDVRLLLHSHEHFDHVGGMARMQRLTGARLLASKAAAPVLASGEAGADDPQAGMHAAMAPARVDGIVDEGDQARVGDLVLAPVATPGHTPGALSWAWTSCEGEDCRNIVFADSLSPISRDDYRFSDHPEYVASFRAGLARLAGLDCAILLTPHPGVSDMHGRLASAGGLAGPPRCRDFAGRAGARLDARLEKEHAK